jgi:hypothetical protein
MAPIRLSTVATSTPAVADFRTDAGVASSAAVIAAASTAPANLTVRPALLAATFDASRTLAPAASSRRKRATSSSE